MTWKTIVVCENCYRERRKTDDELVTNPIRLVVVEDTCFDCGAVEAAIPIRANVEPPLPPICPGCLAVAEMTAFGWETIHELDCSWMQDPDSERYD